MFGLDRSHVENAIARAGGYTDLEATQYVEKLFQARLTLPTPTIEQLELFIANALDKTPFKEDKQNLSSTLKDLMPPNPRFIKNFINGLIVHHQFALSTSDDELKLRSAENYLSQLVLVHFLRTIFPDAYEIIAQKHEGALAEFIQVCDNAKVLNNERMQFFFTILENPLFTTAQSEGSHNPTPSRLGETRFRRIRSDAWRSRALDTFRTHFKEQFRTYTVAPQANDEYLTIEPYLV
uniref:KAP P-loop domain protein n=1 Tax=Magnetococcus massalia (strain MO-1) TaxID=451514 RepID=A0A1S7LMV0_MAGMO